MILKKIEDLYSWEFKESLDIYKSSFPPNETRPVDKIVKMLKEDRNYHLLIAANNSSVVGISLLYTFRSLRIGLLDYMAVHSNYQGRGIGKKLFGFTAQMLRSHINPVIGLIMEIQKENVPDPHDRLKRKDRIKFYQQLGARVLDGVNYPLPSQNRGKPEDMYLMIVPLTNVYSISKHLVIEYVSAIYSTIYEDENKDLLNSMTCNLPSTIMIRELVT